MPETSCEQRNEFIDRALVVTTVAARRAGRSSLPRHEDPEAIIATLSDAALTALATAVEAGLFGGGSLDAAFASIVWVGCLDGDAFQSTKNVCTLVESTTCESSRKE